jgi:hypothetical protein
VLADADRRAAELFFRGALLAERAAGIVAAVERDPVRVSPAAGGRLGLLVPGEAASAGFYSSPWGSKHPTPQLLTIKELLDGKGIDYPRMKANVTFKKAPRATYEPRNQELPLQMVAERSEPPRRPRRRKGSG